MNELTFMLAVLFEKGVINGKEVRALHNVALNSSINNSLAQMLSKVQPAIRKANAKTEVDKVDASQIIK